MCPPTWPESRFRNHNDGMTIRHRTLLLAAAAAAAAAFALAGCSTAPTEGAKGGQSASAGSSVTAVSEANKKEAQQLAEDAEKVMLDPALPPREKYPKALGMFRDALKIDPDNALAKDSIKLIEDIYKGMGRPVPEPA